MLPLPDIAIKHLNDLAAEDGLVRGSFEDPAVIEPAEDDDDDNVGDNLGYGNEEEDEVPALWSDDDSDDEDAARAAPRKLPPMVPAGGGLRFIPLQGSTGPVMPPVAVVRPAKEAGVNGSVVPEVVSASAVEPEVSLQQPQPQPQSIAPAVPHEAQPQPVAPVRELNQPDQLPAAEPAPEAVIHHPDIRGDIRVEVNPSPLPPPPAEVRGGPPAPVSSRLRSRTRMASTDPLQRLGGSNVLLAEEILRNEIMADRKFAFKIAVKKAMRDRPAEAERVIYGELRQILSGQPQQCNLRPSLNQ